MAALTPLPLSRALPAHGLEFLLDLIDALLDAAPVRFQLRFTFAAAHADAAFLAGQMAPKTRQPRAKMLQLRELDLQFAFASAGALSKNIEDQSGSIQHLALEN